MSTLQISLALIGAFLLAAVVGHGAWSARRNQPKRATPQPAPTQQEPLQAEVDGQQVYQGQSDEPTERSEPSFNANLFGDPALPSLETLTVLEKKVGLDVLIDSMALISVESVVSGDAALAAMPTTNRAGSKPFGVEGFCTTRREWEYPVAGHRYSAFQCAVQLANRVGALNQIEYSEFVIKAQAFADAVGGEPEFPDMLDEVARARELDQFASAHDAQLSFTLRAFKTAWSPGYVQQNAARLGFIAGSTPGRMVLPASQPGYAPMVSLEFDKQAAMAEDPEQTALYELTLALDVPQVLRSEQPFPRMCEVAIALATNMEGLIIDDNGERIKPEAMEAIYTDLEKLYDNLDTRDLAAGSVLARRLFS